MTAQLKRLACTALAGASLVLPASALAGDTPPGLPSAPPSLPAAPPSSPAHVGLPTPTAPCLVPSLKGLTVPAASAALIRGGCRLGRVTRRPVAGVRAGLVASQAQRPGSAFAGSSAVAVTVSTGRV